LYWHRPQNQSFFFLRFFAKDKCSGGIFFQSCVEKVAEILFFTARQLSAAPRP
jgi:hypothetical protein